MPNAPEGTSPIPAETTADSAAAKETPPEADSLKAAATADGTPAETAPLSEGSAAEGETPTEGDAPAEGDAPETPAPEAAPTAIVAEQTEAPAAPKKSKKMLVLAATATVVVLGLFFSRAQLLKVFAPERYFDQVSENTWTQMMQTPGIFPDYTNLLSNPFMLSMGVDMDMGLAEYRYSANLAARANPKAGQLLYDLAVHTPYASLDPLRFYIDPQTIGAHMPQLYQAHSYIVVNLETLEQEWASWPYAAGEPLPDETLEFIQQFPALLQYTIDQSLGSYGAGQLPEALLEEFQGLWDVLNQTRQFEALGNTSYTLLRDGAEASGDCYVVTYPQAEIETFLNNYIHASLNYSLTLLDAMPYPQSMKDEMRTELQASGLLEDSMQWVAVANDLTVRYYINAHNQISRVETTPLDITGRRIDSYGDYDEQATLSMVLDFNGSTHLLDEIDGHFLIATPSYYGEGETDESTVIFRHSLERGGTLSYRMEFGIGDESSTETVALDFNWAQAGDGAMKLVIGAADDSGYSSDIELEMTGTLTATSSELRLSDLRFKAYGYSPPVVVNMAMHGIDAAELDVNLTDSISLFALTAEDIAAIEEKATELFE